MDQTREKVNECLPMNHIGLCNIVRIAASSIARLWEGQRQYSSGWGSVFLLHLSLPSGSESVSISMQQTSSFYPSYMMDANADRERDAEMTGRYLAESLKVMHNIFLSGGTISPEASYALYHCFDCILLATLWN